MATQTIQLMLMEGKELRQKLTLRQGSKSSPQKIQATPDGKFVLADKDTGIAPENITVRRVGKNLLVCLEGDSLDQPSLIIEDFFEHNAELIGMSEDGAYYAYISSDGDNDKGAVLALEDGESSALVLGGNPLGSSDDNDLFGMLPWIIGGILGVGAGAAILGGGKGGGHKQSAATVDQQPPAPTPETPSPSKPTPGGENQGVKQVIDNQGPIQGVIEKGGVTDDTTPTLNGSGNPGDTVVIIDNGKPIGETVVDDNGNWTFTPETELGDGEHEIGVIIKDKDGNETHPDDTWVVVIDTQAPDAPSIVGVYDDVGTVTGALTSGAVTDDACPTLSGKAEANATVFIYGGVDGKQLLGKTQANANGDWSFTPEKPLAEGPHSLTARAQDAAGNLSQPSKIWDVVIDTTAPGKPGTDGESAGISEAIDDQGPIQGPIEKGDVTDDSTPTFNGTGEPGDTVIILDKGEKIGETIVDEDGNWSFTPDKPLDDGDHSVTVIIQDPAGNQSEPSDPWEVVVDTQAPDAPTIGSVFDDVGAIIGELAPGAITDDTQPTFSGQAEAGAVVSIYDGAQKLGEVQADENGNWSFTPDEPLTQGEHSFTARAQDAAGNESESSQAWELEIITPSSQKPSTGIEGPGISEVIDNQGPIQGPIEQGGVTDDTTPTVNGTGEPGDTIIIRDGEEEIGRVEVGSDGNWSFTPDEPLAEGEHEINVIIQDKAGNPSDPSDPWIVTIDTQAPDAPVIGSIYDDVGDQTGPLNPGDITDDSRPTINGSAEPGANVIIYDRGQKIGETLADANGVWSFTPKQPLAAGNHEITVQAEDAAGNLSETSPAFDFSIVAPGVPASPAITAVIDDIGVIQGALQKGDVTDDARPTLRGSSEPGSTITVYSNGTPLGTTVADAQGLWSFTPSTDLAEGLNTLTVMAKNPAGNESPKTGGFDLIVDTTAPDGLESSELLDDVGDIQGPIANGDTTDDAQPTFNGKTEPHATVVIYDAGQKIGEVQADAEGNWSFTPSTALSDGEHSLSAQVFDQAGNAGPTSDEVNFIVDTRLVEVSIDAVIDDFGSLQGPINNGGVTDDTTPTLTGRATPEATVVIYDNGVEIGRVQSDASGQWSFTPETSLGEGKHALSASVITEAGGESSATPPFEFYVDITAPEKPGIGGEGHGIGEVIDDVGTIQGPIANGGTTDDTTPTFSGTGEAGDTVHIYDGEDLLGSVNVKPDGTWSFTPPPLVDGEHQISVTIEDEAGNQSEPSDPWIVIVDTHAPDTPTIGGVYDDVGAITGELVSGSVTDDTQPTFTGQAEAGAIVSIFDGEEKLGEVQADENGNWSFTPEEALSEGEHSFTVRAQDAAGNLSEPSQPWEVVIDTTSPVKPGSEGSNTDISEVIDDHGPIQGPIEQGGITDDNTPTFNGTGDVGDTIIIRDGEEEIGRVDVDSDGNWSFTPEKPLADGEHEISVIVQDEAGNQSEPSDPWIVTVDTQAPEAPTIGSVYDDVGAVTGELASGDTTDDQRPTFSGQAEAGAIVSIYDGEQKLGEVQADEHGNWSFTPEQPLTEGEHSFTAKATDAAGNESEQSQSWDLVVTAPDLTVAQPAINAVTDDVGPLTGALHFGDVTDDSRPQISGRSDPGVTVHIYDRGVELGSVQADENGNWSFAPEQELVDGEYSFSAVAENSAGTRSPASESFDLIIYTGNGPTQVARLSHMGKDSGQDGHDFVTDNGTYGRLMHGLLSAELAAGQTLQVSTDGGKTWFDALVDGTSWAAQDRSSHTGNWNIQTRVVDQAGNSGYVMQQAVVLDTLAPRAPSSIQLDGSHLQVGFDASNVAVGDRIAIIADGGAQRFEHTLTQEDIAAGFVNLEVGSISSASAAIVDQAGNLSGFANTGAAPSVNYLLTGDVTEVYGQSRDNVFSIEDVSVLDQIKVIEGNGGVDTLRLLGADQVLDLSALQGRLSSIEVIDLSGTGNNTLKVSLGDVLELGNQRAFINDDNVQLAIKGDAGDVVMLNDLLPNGMDVGDWENLGSVTAAGIVYEVYQHTGLEAEILVQEGVAVQLH
ncbi:Ig-like domain-containing protein [Pseudomonas putida]|uniref:Ig-like domain-containing protein n=1 Tax=Pseudomonas putida TaxID=303 RepID=UPI00300F0B6F